jgi:deoxycytidylate deaminase
MNVYVVRKKSETNMGDSAPCNDCYHKMCELGIKNIIYSSSDEKGLVTIVKQKLKDYKPKTISLGRQFIENGMIPIYRNRAIERIINYENEI